MRYFHRTTVPPAEIISEADRHFGRLLETTTQSDRARELLILGRGKPR